MSIRDHTALGETAHAGQVAMPGEIELEPGQLFRGLKIRALLGSGAMGNAYLASHASLRVPVVIKLFRTHGGDPLAEAHLAARVVSASVVPVLDAGVEHSVPYVVQRYVDGIDLEELLGIHLAGDRAIPVPVIVRFASQIFHALAAIHVAGVIHRDIKPPNLFLAGSGEALIGDFGIAVDPTLAHHGEVAGTPMFIAPELWAGQPPTARTDLYSAAATLHLLWQRTPPFVGDTASELARLHREKPYVPPASADPIGAYFGAVLARLLAKDPDERPESALGAARLIDRIATAPPGLRGHEDGLARVGDVVIAVEQGDICDARTDVIVCAANERLSMERGVAGAVRKRGGDEIQTEAMRHGPVTMGQVVWTRPGTLACKQVAHAVAALDGAICIQRAVLRTLFEAERRGHRTIAFPALGTGVGAVPVGFSARLMLEAIRTFAAFQPAHLRSIRITLSSTENVAAWTSAMIALDTDAATD